MNARWYLDASGTARVFARAMEIPVTFYGRTKVCLWTYFDTPPLHDGTVFFVDNSDDYLELGVGHPDLAAPRRASASCCRPTPCASAGAAGDSVETILRDELERYARFDRLLDGAAVR